MCSSFVPKKKPHSVHLFDTPLLTGGDRGQAGDKPEIFRPVLDLCLSQRDEDPLYEAVQHHRVRVLSELPLLLGQGLLGLMSLVVPPNRI